jgi:hypothetical protein
MVLDDDDGDTHGTMRFKISDASATAYLQIETAGEAFTGGKWHHIVCTYSGDPAAAVAGTDATLCLKMYVDGEELSVSDNSSSPGSYVAMEATGDDVYIGNRVATNYWEGNIGEVAIFSEQLSLENVKALYNAREGVGPNSNVAQSLGYISGSEGVGLPAGTGYESKYGFTIEADVVFPNYENALKPVDRNNVNVSLFGMCSASVDEAADVADRTERPPNDTTWYTNDNVSMQVYAVRDEPGSKNIRFKLTSSLLGPGSTDDTRGPFPTLTSSTFYDVYDNQRWNLSVRLKPSNYPLADVVSGSDTYTYDVIFKGTNAELGVVRNSFELTSSLTKAVGQSFLKAAKRVSVGAHKTNVTGALLTSCDTLIDGTRYWLKYLDDLSLNQHAYDVDNHGISGSYQNTSPLDWNLKNSGSILNSNMLALNWEFNNITSSNVYGGFEVMDLSSGSALIRDNFSWVGQTAGYQLPGSGSGWSVSTQNIIQSQSVNSYQFINPEMAVSSDMVQILSADDTYFGVSEMPPDFFYTLEKSMYNAISEEMLNFFAGVVDFNNVIGEPINRYRARYKTLEKLRESFFRRVTTVKEVEKFLKYYKWFDDAIAEVIGQLLPATSNFTEDAYNTIESHVLERNKYWSKFPILDYKEPTIEGLLGEADAGFAGTSPAAESPRPTNKNAIFWKNIALRSAPEITSGDASVDKQRENIRKIAASVPVLAVVEKSLEELMSQRPIAPPER